MADKNINYKTAVDYWSSVPTDIDGVLGGYGFTNVPKLDVVGSQAFVRRLGSLSPNTFPNVNVEPAEKSILDVGSGIGRVTKDLLYKWGEQIDILEPAPPLIEQAKIELQDIPAVRNFYELGMQDFPFDNRYWVVWCQWCLSQLPDEALVEFLIKARSSLQPGGLIIAKENVAPSEDLFDEADSSVARTDAHFRDIFQKAGLRLLLTSVQKGMPQELLPIRMYALAPQ